MVNGPTRAICQRRRHELNELNIPLLYPLREKSTFKSITNPNKPQIRVKIYANTSKIGLLFLAAHQRTRIR